MPSVQKHLSVLPFTPLLVFGFRLCNEESQEHQQHLRPQGRVVV